MQRTLIEIGASVGASAIMLAATIVGGRLVMAQTTPVLVERPASASCDERPLAGVNGSAAHGVSHLCLTMDGADPTIELTGLPVGAVFSAWAAYVDRPSIVRAGECSTPELAARDQIGAPGRLASGIADRDGRLVLASALSGLRPSAGSVVEILVVQHAALTDTARPERARQLLAWDRVWSDARRAPNGPDQSVTRLLGCSSFWVRGGAEQAEH